MSQRHHDHDTLERLLGGLPAPPTDGGTVQLVVARHPDGRRTPRVGRFTRDGGLHDDRWILGKADLQAQVTVMRADVATVLTGGQDLTAPGDNLLVHLDLHTANLPTGTVLGIGSATFEVTPKPHTGCKKFRQRFGLPALEITLADAWRPHRLRGIHLRVRTPGEVRPGDTISVLERP